MSASPPVSNNLLSNPLLLCLWPWLAEIEASFPWAKASFSQGSQSSPLSDEDILRMMAEEVPIEIRVADIAILYLWAAPEEEVSLRIDNRYSTILDSSQTSEYFLLALTNFGASAMRRGEDLNRILWEKLSELKRKRP